jgi:hypothetical protein
VSLENIEVIGIAELTPELVAQMFWEMNSDEQADFFAHLERIAGIQLCFQMAAVVQTIQKRCDKGDYTAQNGFQTMLNHAQAFGESATDYRVADAKWQIKKMVERAKETHS